MYIFFALCLARGVSRGEANGGERRCMRRRGERKKMRRGAGKENLYRKLDLKNAEILGALLSYRKLAIRLSLCKSGGRK